MGQPILIVGASGRAAAASAIRAGLEPFVIDLFADADTKRLCPVLRCQFDDYPYGFIELAKQVPPSQWMYTGGLENYPVVVAAISESRTLWGNGPDVLRMVRDPWLLDSLPRHVVGFAEVLPRNTDPSFSTLPYLRKPLGGSGGGGIRVATSTDRPCDHAVYYQEFIDGEPRSAVFYCENGKPMTLGCTVQLVGTAWLHAGQFRYAGNITRPWEKYPIASFDTDLCQGTSLRGLIGTDYIVNWVVDVNPRYTASIEVLEFAHGVPLLNRTSPPPQPTRVVGKAIYYAENAITFPTSGPWDESLAKCIDVWRRPDYADIPEPGTVIESGHPVLTIFGESGTEQECIEQLKRRAAELDQLFGVTTPSEDEP